MRKLRTEVLVRLLFERMGWLRAYVLTDRNFGSEMSRMIAGREKVRYK
jgi:hypothetical protein